MTSRVELRIKMDDKLIGNPFHNILHGGVTASLLDVARWHDSRRFLHRRAGGFLPSYPQGTLSRLGTIDLRIDYLRPGRGNEFIATAHIIAPVARSPSPVWNCTMKKGPHRLWHRHLPGRIMAFIE